MSRCGTCLAPMHVVEANASGGLSARALEHENDGGSDSQILQ